MTENPTSFIINGYSEKINTDYRNAIHALLYSEDAHLSDGHSMSLQMRMLFTEWGTKEFDARFKKSPMLYLEKMASFLRCGKKPVENNIKNKILDYNKDWDLIVAAFLSQYGIDLMDKSIRLHWWKFQALFHGLDSECELMKRISYRAADLSKIKDKETRKHYQEMKRLYSIDNEPEQKVDVQKLIIRNALERKLERHLNG